MTDDYKRYEAACDRIRKENETLLKEFRSWLASDGLSQKVIDGHIDNVGFFIDTFLLRDGAVPAAAGATKVCNFLGGWFIRKCLWANKSSIRANAASLKKFYTFMVEQGKTPPEDLEILKEDIKEEMDEWLAELRRFDSLADEF
jgi:hypothetical protein